MMTTTDPPLVLRRRRMTWAVLASVAVVIVAAAAWWLLQGDRTQLAATPATPAAPATAAPVAPGEGATQHSSATDAASTRATEAVRFEEVSSHALYRRWLAENDAMQRTVAAVVAIAQGESAASLVDFVRPRGVFQVEERNGRVVIAAASFHRYDDLADVIGSVDAKRAVAAYRTMKPALARMHAQVARPRVTLDESVRAALRHLLEAPTTGDEIVVVPAEGINYAYADAAIEKRSAAQKQIVRMGAKNAARVKAKLREIEGELTK